MASGDVTRPCDVRPALVMEMRIGVTPVSDLMRSATIRVEGMTRGRWPTKSTVVLPASDWASGPRRQRMSRENSGSCAKQNGTEGILRMLVRTDECRLYLADSAMIESRREVRGVRGVARGVIGAELLLRGGRGG